jgi:uncharacterized protein YndB with AHSA1/START domain
MAFDFIRVSTVLPASAARVYAAWLDAEKHSRMTGGAATVDPTVGGFHSAWDGYIAGRILELEPGARIVQSWRTTQFPVDHPHSRLEIRLRDVPGGCEITLVHSEIPEGQGERYESGWQGHYFNPMTEYFRAIPEAAGAQAAAGGAAKKPAKKTSVKKPAKKTSAKKPAKKTSVKKPAKKTSAKKPAKKTSAKKPAKKTSAKRAK